MDRPPADRGVVALAIARGAIADAFGLGAAVAIDEPWLRPPGASFVTLCRRGALRGCVGSIEALRPLADDIRRNALAAAFHDKRFAPLTKPEFADTEVEVSLLSPLSPIGFVNEESALAQLRPGVDGVVFEFGTLCATFLPQVWERIPERREFLAHLKHKAGLAPDFWAAGVQLSRYTVTKYSEADFQ
jgi:AmmeMemoRadiSam system protein A